VLEYLAIIDYLNNAHDSYDTRIRDYGIASDYAAHVFNLRSGILFVEVREKGIFYELRDVAQEEVIDSGEIITIAQLRDLHAIK